MSWLIEITIQGSIVALLILLIKGIFKNAMSPKWHLVIWIILLVKLFVPVLPQSDLSIFNQIPEISQYQEETVIMGTLSPMESYEDSDPNAVLSLNNSKQQNVAIKDIEAWVIRIWAAGMFATALYMLFVYVRFIRNVRCMREEDDEYIVSLLNKCKTSMGISQNVKLLRGGKTPMLMGVFKPHVLIPEGYTSNEIEQILIHEMLHLKHCDLWVNMLGTVACCIYWFNPVIWMSISRVRKDIEILCDARALKFTDDKTLYAKTLVKTVMKKQKVIVVTTAMQNGEKEITKRITKIAKNKKPKLIYSVIGVLLIVALASVTVTARAEEIIDRTEENFENSSIENSIDNPNNDELEQEETDETTSKSIMNELGINRLVIEPSHGGKDYGFVSTDGLMEKDINLAIALEIDKVSDTYLLRRGDTYISHDDIKSSLQDGDLLISIRCDSSPDEQQKGLSVVYSEDNYYELSEALCQQLSNDLLVDCTLIKSTGSKLLENGVPTIVINVGYMTNLEELSNLADSTYQKKIAQAIAKILNK